MDQQRSPGDLRSDGAVSTVVAVPWLGAVSLTFHVAVGAAVVAASPPPSDPTSDTVTATSNSGAADAAVGVPRLLPAEAVDGQASRFGYPFDGPASPSHHDLWIGERAGAVAAIEVSTYPGGVAPTPPESRLAVIIPGWREAFFVGGDRPFDHVAMIAVDDDGYVRVNTFGLTVDEAFELVGSMSDRDPDGGWSPAVADPTGWARVAGGWASAGEVTSVSWTLEDRPVAELTVAVGMPSLAHSNSAGARLSVGDIGGVAALVASHDGYVTVVWTYHDAMVRLQAPGTEHDVVPLASSVGPVDDQTWSAIPVAELSEGECSGFGC